MIREISVKTAIHHHGKGYGSGFDLNIYRGCEHQCKYCFAQYTHTKYLNNQDFYGNIFVKTNVADILDKELSKKTWDNRNVLNISGICDCYQPIEEKYQLMRSVLKILIKHKQSIYVLTKGHLIMRDYDLFNELCKVAPYCNITSSITTLDENIRTKIEPNVIEAMERIKILSEFSKIPNCKTTIMLIPIIPYLTDKTRDLEEMYRVAKEYNIKYIIAGVLNMRGEVKTNFYHFLSLNFPETYRKIQALYRDGYVSKEYETKLYKILNSFHEKYEIYGYGDLRGVEREKKGQMEFEF
ncbi:MAG: hypothetical protein LBT02_02285 [Rickettsiales bacterium]|jgi:DNA repair photolyase|nr:hypothetical protein [Rickettsiales bacterium]